MRLAVKIISASTIVALIIATLSIPEQTEAEEVKLIAKPITEEISAEEIEIEQEEVPETEYDWDDSEDIVIYEVEAMSRVAELDEIKYTEEYLFKYKTIVDDYAVYFGRPVELEDVFTNDEIRLMCRCIETEICGGDFKAKINVATVIINRIEDERFGGDATTVVTSPNQFSYWRTEYTEETLHALEYAYLFGSEEVDDCLFFQSAGAYSTWQGRELKHYDGYHWFY